MSAPLVGVLLALLAPAPAGGGCPATIAEVEALIAGAMITHPVPESKTAKGLYEPVAVPMLGGEATRIVRVEGGPREARFLWMVSFRLDGEVADYQTAFLAALPIPDGTMAACEPDQCEFGRDFTKAGLPPLRPATLKTASLTKAPEASKVHLSCLYSAP